MKKYDPLIHQISLYTSANLETCLTTNVDFKNIPGMVLCINGTFFSHHKNIKVESEYYILAYQLESWKAYRFGNDPKYTNNYSDEEDTIDGRNKLPGRGLAVEITLDLENFINLEYLKVIINNINKIEDSQFIFKKFTQFCPNITKIYFRDDEIRGKVILDLTSFSKLKNIDYNKQPYTRDEEPIKILFPEIIQLDCTNDNCKNEAIKWFYNDYIFIYNDRNGYGDCNDSICHSDNDNDFEVSYQIVCEKCYKALTLINVSLFKFFELIHDIPIWKEKITKCNDHSILIEFNKLLDWLKKEPINNFSLNNLNEIILVKELENYKISDELIKLDLSVVLNNKIINDYLTYRHNKILEIIKDYKFEIFDTNLSRDIIMKRKIHKLCLKLSYEIILINELIS